MTIDVFSSSTNTRRTPFDFNSPTWCTSCNRVKSILCSSSVRTSLSIIMSLLQLKTTIDYQFHLRFKLKLIYQRCNATLKIALLTTINHSLTWLIWCATETIAEYALILNYCNPIWGRPSVCHFCTFIILTDGFLAIC